MVAFLSDHGTHLGEGGHFWKRSQASLAARIPMMVRVPGVTQGGQVVGNVVEALGEMFGILLMYDD